MTTLLDIGSRVCLVCGNPEFPSFVDGLTTFEICPICRCQSGYEYDTGTSEKYLMELRRTWLIDNGGKWFHDTQPKDWNPLRQLNEAGLPIPEEAT